MVRRQGIDSPDFGSLGGGLEFRRRRSVKTLFLKASTLLFWGISFASPAFASKVLSKFGKVPNYTEWNSPGDGWGVGVRFGYERSSLSFVSRKDSSGNLKAGEYKSHPVSSFSALLPFYQPKADPQAFFQMFQTSLQIGKAVTEESYSTDKAYQGADNPSVYPINRAEDVYFLLTSRWDVGLAFQGLFNLSLFRVLAGASIGGEWNAYSYAYRDKKGQPCFANPWGLPLAFKFCTECMRIDAAYLIPAKKSGETLLTTDLPAPLFLRGLAWLPFFPWLKFQSEAFFPTIFRSGEKPDVERGPVVGGVKFTPIPLFSLTYMCKLESFSDFDFQDGHFGFELNLRMVRWRDLFRLRRVPGSQSLVTCFRDPFIRARLHSFKWTN